MVGRALTVLLALIGLTACASGYRRYNIYVEVSAGVASSSIEDEHAFGPTVGAHFGIAKETEHSDGFNVHMGPGGIALLDGTEVRAALAMLTMHLDHTTSRTPDGSRVHRWATIVEGPLLIIPRGPNGPNGPNGDEEADQAAAVSIASGPAREWRARNGFLAGLGILARGLIGGHDTAAAGVEVRFRIGFRDHPGTAP